MSHEELRHKQAMVNVSFHYPVLCSAQATEGLREESEERWEDEKDRTSTNTQ